MGLGVAMSTYGELFAPAVLLPIQFFGRLHAPRIPGEKALLIAVLETALSDLDAYPPTHRLHRDAATWLAGSDGPFSFRYVCEQLGLDADTIREAVDKRHASARG